MQRRDVVCALGLATCACLVAGELGEATYPTAFTREHTHQDVTGSARVIKPIAGITADWGITVTPAAPASAAASARAPRSRWGS